MTVESTPPDPSLVAAGHAAARLSKSLETALSDLNLSLPQYRLLVFLSGGPERATALAEWLSVSPPSLTALVDGAVSRGHVERVAVEGDRRSVRHRMTEGGRAVLQEADAAVTARLAELTAHLSADDSRRAREGLELIGMALDAARAEKDAAKAAEKAAGRQPAGAGKG